jgi:hypothetical protein
VSIPRDPVGLGMGLSEAAPIEDDKRLLCCLCCHPGWRLACCLSGTSSSATTRGWCCAIWIARQRLGVPSKASADTNELVAESSISLLHLTRTHGPNWSGAVGSRLSCPTMLPQPPADRMVFWSTYRGTDDKSVTVQIRMSAGTASRGATSKQTPGAAMLASIPQRVRLKMDRHRGLILFPLSGKCLPVI